MERTTDWKGPVALVLAGLALLVALGGRDLFSWGPGPQNAFVRAERVLPWSDAKPADPYSPVPPSSKLPAQPAIPDAPELKIQPPDLQIQPPDTQPSWFFYSDSGMANGFSGKAGIFLDHIWRFLRIAGLVLLVVLAYRFFTGRNRRTYSYAGYPHSSPPPPQPPSPPGEAPRSGPGVYD